MAMMHASEGRKLEDEANARKKLDRHEYTNHIEKTREPNRKR